MSDLDASLGFYVNTLEFGLLSRDQDADIALVDASGYPILLAGPIADDLAPYLNDIHEFIKLGGNINAFGSDLDALKAELDRRGIDTRLRQRPWGDRELLVIDPDGYTVVFWTIVERTLGQTIKLYAAGVDRLARAASGLSETDLELSLEPDSWSIRQIIHHLADSEATALGGPKMALAEPGRVYLGNSYNQDVWAAGLAYSARPIEASVALFNGIRAHVLDLLSYLPGAWDRFTVDAEGKPSMTVGVVVGMLSSHALQHIDDIEEIRRVYEVWGNS